MAALPVTRHRDGRTHHRLDPRHRGDREHDERDARQRRTGPELLVHRIRDRGADDGPPRPASDEARRDGEDRIAVEQHDQEATEDQEQSDDDEEGNVRTRGAEEFPGAEEPGEHQDTRRGEDDSRGGEAHREDRESDGQGGRPRVLQNQVLGREGSERPHGAQGREGRADDQLAPRRAVRDRLRDVPDRSDDIQFGYAEGGDGDRGHRDQESDRESGQQVGPCPIYGETSPSETGWEDLRETPEDDGGDEQSREGADRSEEHTSELQSLTNLVC